MISAGTNSGCPGDHQRSHPTRTLFEPVIDEFAMIDPTKIWSLAQLPSLPAVAQTLLKLAANPETELRQVVLRIHHGIG